MRRLILAVVLTLAVARPGFAQVSPGEAVILQNEIEVRSGPSKNFYPTSRLVRGDKVNVLRESKEAPGWLEITPPAGSFSWINAKYVKIIEGSRQGYVDLAPGSSPVPIMPGSRIADQPPNREIMKLSGGAQIVLVAQPLQLGGETWYPIEKHPGEVRYIPIEAVKNATTVTTTTSPQSWIPTAQGYMGNATLADAEKAVAANDIARARALFQQIANSTSDANQRVYALNRLASLPQQQSPFATTSNPNQTSTSFSSGPPPAIPGLMQLSPETWTQYGRLRDTGLKREDGQPIYSLEDQSGRVITRVTMNPGKSLQTYVGRIVAVYGPTMYRPTDANKMQYVVASHVAVP